MKKKMISIVLCLAMVLSSSMVAMAQNDAGDSGDVVRENQSISQENNGELIASINAVLDEIDMDEEVDSIVEGAENANFSKLKEFAEKTGLADNEFLDELNQVGSKESDSVAEAETKQETEDTTVKAQASDSFRFSIKETIMCVNSTMAIFLSGVDEGESVYYYSTDDSILSISSNDGSSCDVTAKKTGNVYVVATTDDGHYANCLVKIKDYSSYAQSDWNTIKEVYPKALPERYDPLGTIAYTDHNDTDTILTSVCFELNGSTHWLYFLHHPDNDFVTVDIDEYYDYLYDHVSSTSAKLLVTLLRAQTMVMKQYLLISGCFTYPIIKIYRLYNPKSNEHLWTASSKEYNTLPSYGWRKEGIAWNAREYTYVGVYRLYNPKSGDHHYTASKNEADTLVKSYGWRYDNNKKPLFYSGGKTPIYRLYNKKYKRGSHHLTKSKNEYNTLANLGWKKEGIALYCEK